nr:zinc knuckle CX2CX4HX4C [Tanacetum cinerariifolium]
MDTSKIGSGRVKLDGKGTTKRVTLIGSPMVSNYSSFVSPSTTINMPRGPYSIDVAATFKVPLTIVDNNNVDVIPYMVSHVDDLINLIVDESTIPSEPIVQSVNINTKSTFFARATGASAKDQPKVNSNFRIMVVDPVFDGVNISIPCKVIEKVSTRFEHTIYGYFIGKIMAFLVVEYYARNNWMKHELKRIMMNSKGFFFFKFNSRAGLEAVLEGGPWLIRKSLIILKKWSMDTRLLKEELTRILIWVKLHDVPIQVFKEDGISLISTFIGKPVMLDSYTSFMCNESYGRSSFAWCLIEVNSEAGLVDVVTMGIPSLSGDGFTKETIGVEHEWRPPRCDICKIFGHVHDHCPKKAASPPIVTTSNVVTPIVKKTNDATTSAPKEGVTNVGNTSQLVFMLKTAGYSYKKDNLSMSNSFSTLNEKEGDDEEYVQNVYDESANLLQNKKAGGSSYFTATTVYNHKSEHLEGLHKSCNYVPTYTLFGFVWAFKILEFVERNNRWWNKVVESIPRGVGWSKKAIFKRSDYSTLFCKESNPIFDLRPTLAEYQSDWWTSTIDFLQVYVPRIPMKKLDTHYYLLDEEVRMRLEEEERLLLEEERLIEDEKRGKLEEQKRLIIKEKRALEVKKRWDKDYRKRESYSIAWTSADKVFIPIDEAEQHWCLVEVDILSGVVTFYDSGDSCDVECRDWYIHTRDCLQGRLPEVLGLVNVFDKKGIDKSTYRVTFRIVKNVPKQGVCLVIVDISLDVDDPVQTALADCERIL